MDCYHSFVFFQAEDGIRDIGVTGVQTCALPISSRRTSELWVERTPPDFTFDIKANALMTGQPTETRRLPKDLRTALPAELQEKTRIYAKDLPDELRGAAWEWFVDGVEPLTEAGQLGSVLLQFPRWFFTSSENREIILEAKEDR